LPALLEIAETLENSKVEAQDRSVESNPLAGLVAMHRWGWISIEQYALARGVSYRQANKHLKEFAEKHGITKSITTKHPGLRGSGISLYGLTAAGERTLLEECPSLGDAKSLPSFVNHGGKFLHKHDIISSILTAEFCIGGSDRFFITNLLAEFERSKGRMNTAPTAINITSANEPIRFIPDAFVDILDQETGLTVRYFIELDRGHETVISLKANDPGKTLMGMFLNYWRYFAECENPEMMRVLLIGAKPSVISHCLKAIPWGDFQPIGDWTPANAFRLSRLPDSVGVRKSKKPRVNGNFFGPVWSRPGHSTKTPLLVGFD